MVKIAKIIKTHGVHGKLKVYSYCENLETLLTDGAFLETEGEKITVKSCDDTTNDAYIIKIENINSINDAKLLINKDIFIPELKKQDGEFFEYEVIGFDVFEENSNESIGKLSTFHHFKHNKMLEIALSKPFSRGNIAKNKLYVSRQEVISFNENRIIIKRQMEVIDCFD